MTRLLAIGDIHGCSTALDRLLDAVKLRKTDKIVTLGDYINKGPDSKGVIERLVQLDQQGQLIPLKGNHEIELLEAREDKYHRAKWLNLRGEATLSSYSRKKSKDLSVIPSHHWRFLRQSCLKSWSTEQFIFVHANLNPFAPPQQQDEYHLFWEKFINPLPHYSGKTMICGHTSQKDGKPINLGYAICIDTWACGKGWLTCLDVNSGQIWQANQKGRIKTSHIDDFYQIPVSPVLNLW
ncbi:MAG: metallophosphoesterase family protein [Microcystaceae cyanobacterium]